MCNCDNSYLIRDALITKGVVDWSQVGQVAAGRRLVAILTAIVTCLVNRLVAIQDCDKTDPNDIYQFKIERLCDKTL